MRLLKSLLNVAGMIFGTIGVIVCVAALIMLWIVSARLQRVTESLFSKMDDSLIAARERVVQTRERVTAAALTSRDIESALRGWARQEAGQRLILQLHAIEKTERLA